MRRGPKVVIFDRSWYNRAGVERVMGFCTEEQVADFFKAVPLVEQAIVHWLESWRTGDGPAHFPG